MNELQEALATPFDASEIKSYTAGRAGTLTYIDARAVMNRLDEVVGIADWRTEYVVLDLAMKAVECKLSVRIDGEWITKADVGYPNEGRDADNADKEPLKAAFSDALKRAAVQFGIGRHLYADKPARKEAPPSSPVTQAAFDQQKLFALLAENQWTATDLIPVTGKSTTGRPMVGEWFRRNQGKTVEDLIKAVKDSKAGQAFVDAQVPA